MAKQRNPEPDPVGDRPDAAIGVVSGPATATSSDVADTAAARHAGVPDTADVESDVGTGSGTDTDTGTDLATDAQLDPEADENAGPDPGFSLAELAEASGISERTIRYYQSEKLIPKPSKQGRERRYRKDHLDRLALIVDLRDRGLNLNTIRDLVDNDDPTRTVASWLGIDAALRVPWSDDRSRTVSLAELRDLVGEQTPGLLAELHDAGFTRANDDGTWTVPSPGLLVFALRLRESGVDLETAAFIRDVLRKRLSKAVDQTVDHLVARWKDDFGTEGGRDRLVGTLATLRPVAGEMTGLILAQEVERALADLVTSRAVDLARTDRSD